MNAKTARHINEIMATTEPETIRVPDAPMVLKLYRRDGFPVLIDFQHVKPLGAIQSGFGYYGLECSGVMALHPDYGSDVWAIRQEEPLTLTPSLSCKRCGAHGHITDGRWSGVVPIPNPEEEARLMAEYEREGFIR